MSVAYPPCVSLEPRIRSPSGYGRQGTGPRHAGWPTGDLQQSPCCRRHAGGPSKKLPSERRAASQRNIRATWNQARKKPAEKKPHGNSGPGNRTRGRPAAPWRTEAEQEQACAVGSQRGMRSEACRVRGVMLIDYADRHARYVSRGRRTLLPASADAAPRGTADHRRAPEFRHSPASGGGHPRAPAARNDGADASGTSCTALRAADRSSAVPRDPSGWQGCSLKEDVIGVALRVAAAFQQVGAQYFVGGSLASSPQGEPRATNDIDFVIEMPVGKVGAFRIMDLLDRLES